MYDNKQPQTMELLDRINARKRQVNSLETKLTRANFDYERVPLKRKAAYGALFRHSLPVIFFSMIEVTCLVVLVSTIVSVVKAGGKATPMEGIVILIGSLVVIFFGYTCVKYWMRAAEVITYLKDLKDEEIQLATKRITLTEKLSECKAELEALIKKQEGNISEINR